MPERLEPQRHHRLAFWDSPDQQWLLQHLNPIGTIILCQTDETSTIKPYLLALLSCASPARGSRSLSSTHSHIRVSGRSTLGTSVFQISHTMHLKRLRTGILSESKIEDFIRIIMYFQNTANNSRPSKTRQKNTYFFICHSRLIIMYTVILCSTWSTYGFNLFSCCVYFRQLCQNSATVVNHHHISVPASNSSNLPHCF